MAAPIKGQMCVVFYLGMAPVSSLRAVKSVGPKWITTADNFKGKAWDGITFADTPHHLVLTSAQAVTYRLVHQFGASVEQATDIMRCQSTAAAKWVSYGLAVNDALDDIVSELFVWQSLGY